MDRVVCYVLLHNFEVVGVYSSLALAEHGKTDGDALVLDRQGWFIQEWEMDKFLDATRETAPGMPLHMRRSAAPQGGCQITSPVP